MSDEKALIERNPLLPEVPEEEIGEISVFGVSTEDLDIKAETEKVCLKCKKCGVEQHMTLQEYLDRQKKEGIMRCSICPDRPELFFYKTDMRRIKAAGFNQQREGMGISKSEMKRRMYAIHHSGLGGVLGMGMQAGAKNKDRKKRLPGK